MRRLSRLSIIASFAWACGACCLVPCALAGFSFIRKPVIDIPVSLAKGTVWTKEFGSKSSETYSVIIRAQRRLPFADMNCMMGVSWGESSSFNCDREPLLQADWWLKEGDRVADSGSAYERTGGASTDHTLEKYLGHFHGQAGHKYVVEVRFISDGSALNATNPHLIIETNKPWD